MDIKDKHIVVTGATSGIGKSLVLKLMNAGANVSFCGRNQDRALQLINEFSTKQEHYFYKLFDATIEEDILDFLKDATHTFGNIDVLVNCAGINSSRDSVTQLKTSDLNWMIQVNLVSPFIFMREVYHLMDNKKSGLFINVLSTVCNYSNESLAAYTASKAGFDALVKVFRKEVRENNKKVCAIYPGGVDTPFREASRPKYLKPNAITDAILYMMLQDENSSVDELVLRPLIEKNYS
jgi:NAD(P)-dependent dehydrogenase (short-subunit alcohol dehydrogenase family)